MVYAAGMPKPVMLREAAGAVGPTKTILWPLVVVATRGRPAESAALLRELEQQEMKPTLTVVVGASFSDLPERDRRASLSTLRVVCRQPGLTRQRNRGLAALMHAGFLIRPTHFVAFFDDDFRPANDWLSAASAAFAQDSSLAALTGCVLADGVRGEAISEAHVKAYLDGSRAARAHWSNATDSRAVESLYGCNMAFTTAVAAACNFDDDLPLYGWQEDCDFTGQARRIGDTRIEPACRGVHLGVKSARTSGLRLGYSQIANPLHIANRGNMTRKRMLRFALQAVIANVAKSLLPVQRVDYRGRLRGNLLAVWDAVRGRSSPGRILTLGP